ncbi:hypothetical protein Ciccas_012145 [Cichlidogyrus casuarinus]|uniref:Uncharacterized protein n=1 Tax=Cichlidogyrus casuarinus TaxID=1844966 RepID=A0ABD2PPZ5_9PLAT
MVAVVVCSLGGVQGHQIPVIRTIREAGKEDRINLMNQIRSTDADHGRRVQKISVSHPGRRVAIHGRA